MVQPNNREPSRICQRYTAQNGAEDTGVTAVKCQSNYCQAAERSKCVRLCAVFARRETAPSSFRTCPPLTPFYHRRRPLSVNWVCILSPSSKYIQQIYIYSAEMCTIRAQYKLKILRIMFCMGPSTNVGLKIVLSNKAGPGVKALIL